jgi:ABC-2 type transport system permease protein
MSRFNTLLLREWMQHHRGWLVLMLALPLIVLAVVPFGSVEIGAGEMGPMPALALMLAAMAATPAIVLGITAVSLAVQAPGLARRDRQDRSIEFWLSLPTSHSASVGATVLMHFVLVPLLALAVGAAFGWAIGFALVWKGLGAGAAFGLPWGSLAIVGIAGLLRAALGVVLAVGWLMPVVLLTMAASAWFKRWGVPLLGIGLGVGHKLLTSVYGITAIGDTFTGLLLNARGALFHELPQRNRGTAPTLDTLAHAPGWLFSDGLGALRDLGQPLFVFALAASAACFALLVLRRSRNG